MSPEQLRAALQQAQDKQKQAHHEFQAALHTAAADHKAEMAMHADALQQEYLALRKQAVETTLAGLDTIDKSRREAAVAEDCQRAEAELAKKRKV